MPLSTFAFLYPVADATLQTLRQAVPGIEFLAPENKGLPQGIERAEAAAIGWGGPPIEELLAAAPKLAWLQARGAGMDRAPIAAIRARGITLTNGSGNLAPNMAEHLLALMLAFARGLPGLLLNQQKRHWESPPDEAFFELGGQRLVIVGLGAIGEALAVRAAVMGMSVVGVRRSAAVGPLPPGVSAIVTNEQLDAALGEADHVAVALPLTAETRRLFAAGRFAAMKRGAYFYNVGRGGLVDQEALLAALRSGQLAGAGLDVTDPEPLPAKSPLWREPNVIITAHSSGSTPNGDARFLKLLVDNLKRYAAGEPLRNLVDLTLGY